MGLLAPVPNRFNGIITNLTGQPTTTWGTAVADGTANVYGSYVECIGNTAYDTFFIEISINTIGAGATDPSALLTVGIDHAGGTTYTDVEISHLICAGAGTTAMGARYYWFPLFIPAGSAVAAKLQTTKGTATARVGMRLYGKPSRPELVRAGAYVDTFGAVTATSEGTAITPGTTSEGTVVALASNVAAKNYWWWQGGMGCKDTTMTGGGLYAVLDVGIGTSTSVVDWIFEDQRFAAYNTSEQTGEQQLPPHSYVYEIDTDAVMDVYARSQGSGTPDSSMSAIAYALGG